MFDRVGALPFVNRFTPIEKKGDNSRRRLIGGICIRVKHRHSHVKRVQLHLKFGVSLSPVSYTKVSREEQSVENGTYVKKRD